MAYQDYSNTGIYQRNTKHPQTQKINERLKKMYTAFYKHIKQKAEEGEDFAAYEYNGVQLLTCFDSYIKSKKKMMCYGKEAHTDAGSLFDFPSNYQTDAYYSYDYAIAHRYDKNSPIPIRHCKQTNYLKTRKLISGFNENDTSEKREAETLSILNNNLNKTSLGGNLTPCYPKERKRKPKDYTQCARRDAIVYSPFEFEDVARNIFLHELNILRPTHLIFVSGTGYDNHIIRDFGEAFYLEKIKPLIEQLSVDNPVSAAQEMTEEEIKNRFSIEGYTTGIRIIYAYHPDYHPSATLSKESIEKYDKALSEFVR